MRRLLPALSVLAGALIALSGCGSSSVAQPDASLGTRLDDAVPASVLNAPLTDQHGKATSLADFRGKTVVLGDSMTLCQEVCPLIGANFVQMARETKRAGTAGSIQFIQLTVDPQRDTSPRLAAYRQLFAPAPANWSTLTGPAASIARIWKYFGVGYDKVPSGSPAPRDWWTGKPLTYDVQHTDAVIFLDARQHERFLIVGTPNTGGNQPPQRLKKFLSDVGQRNLNHPNPGDTWTVEQGMGVVRWVESVSK